MQKNLGRALPPLIWTKSKRTAVFPRETVPKSLESAVLHLFFQNASQAWTQRAYQDSQGALYDSLGSCIKLSREPYVALAEHWQPLKEPFCRKTLKFGIFAHI